jgi:hypothetical protein
MTKKYNFVGLLSKAGTLAVFFSQSERHTPKASS